MKTKLKTALKQPLTNGENAIMEITVSVLLFIIFLLASLHVANL